MDEKLFELSQSDVNDVLNFAAQLYGYNRYSGTTAQNQRIMQMTLHNGQKVDMKQIKDAMTNLQADPEQLRAFSEFMESFDSLYARMLMYYGNLLSWDLNFVCRNATPKELQSDAYKQDVKRIYKFLDRFDYKKQFGESLLRVLRYGVDFVWMRDSLGSYDNTGEIILDEDGTSKKKRKNVYALQQMPSRYCKITGFSEYGPTYDLDTSMFLNYGVSPDLYDPVIMDYISDVQNCNDMNYNPTNPWTKRNGTEGMYHQTDPQDGAWCFLYDQTRPDARPPFAPSFIPCLNSYEMMMAQKNVDLAAAKGILFGEIPLLDTSKSGNTQNQTAYSPKTLAQFMKLVKEGLDEIVTAVALPTTDNRFAQVERDGVEDIYSDTISATARNMVSADALLYTTEKPIAEELHIQVEVDYNMVSRLYEQYANFLNYFVNKKLKKFRFNFSFDGCTQTFLRSKHKENILALANVGMVMNPEYYARIVDMRPHDFVRSLEAGHYGNLQSLLTPLLNANTATTSIDSEGDGTVGRPRASAEDAAESTALKGDVVGE